MRTPLLSPGRLTRPASVTAKPVQPGDNLRGAVLMTLSMVGFGCNDTVMKFVTLEMPLYQAIFLRGALVLGGLFLLAWRKNAVRLRIPSATRGIMALRLLGEVGSTVLFLNALQYMAIGDLSAVMQSLPLVVMLGATLIFREPLGWRRLSAVLIGLVGVMIILRPGTDTFGIWSLIALGLVLLVAMRDLSTRSFTADVSSFTIAIYAAMSVTVMGAIGMAVQGWIAPTVQQMSLLVLGAGFLTVGYLSAVAAMRIGEITYVAPFRYTSLIVAILAGLLVFGDWPDSWTWIGSALVVGAGIYSILREAMTRRRR